MAELTTKEKVIALLVKERKRGFDIAYAYKEEHETKAKYGPTDIRWVYEKIADLFRQAGNNISGGNALSDDTMEERVARDYEKELKIFDEVKTTPTIDEMNGERHVIK